MAFRLLVKDELLNQMVDTIGIQVHADDIADKLRNPRFVQQELSSIIPPYFISRSGAINERALRRHLQRLGISVGSFETLVEQVQKNISSPGGSQPIYNVTPQRAATSTPPNYLAFAGIGFGIWFFFLRKGR